MDNMSRYIADSNDSITSALKRIDSNQAKILMVIDSNQCLVGTVTDGDIRRWILAEGKLDATLIDVCNRSPHTVSPPYQIEDVRRTMHEKRISCIPVVDQHRKIIDLLFWYQLFTDAIIETPKCLPIPVVIMAGGQGTRLAPFTQVLPKPLIPIGDKTIIEIIINKFLEYGVNAFYLTVNHKSRIIKSFFEESNPDYSILYIDEPLPLGTAGSLRYLRGTFHGPFIVTNCDIVINCNYEEIYEYHIKNNNVMTIVASLKNYLVPYGVCSLGENGILLEHREKPHYNFFVNTGFYILSSELLELIPEGEHFHMTDLIAEVQKNGGMIGVYPISEDSWVDIGEWEEYRKASAKISMLSGMVDTRF